MPTAACSPHIQGPPHDALPDAGEGCLGRCAMKKILVGAMLVALVSLTAYTCATYAFGWPLLPQAAPAGVTRGTTSFSHVQLRPLRPASVLLSNGKRADASS